MSSILYASLTARDTFNIGDEIQSIAVEGLLPRVDLRIDRMDMASYRSHIPTLLVMNGWFGPRGLGWPPSDDILPVFYGFHVTRRHGSLDTIINPKLKTYYDEYAPVGCRDETTRKALQSIGVEAFTSWCATLTMKRRERAPSGPTGKVFLVNADYVPVPRSISKRAVRINHHVLRSFKPATKRAMAEDLLEMYRNEARLVVTTKIHCAMPCAAMGIPTVFIGDAANPRLEPVGQVLPINDFSHRGLAVGRRLRRSLLNGKFIANVDWDPSEPEYEERKESMVGVFEATLRAVTPQQGSL